jgi:hypothetical protein
MYPTEDHIKGGSAAEPAVDPADRLPQESRYIPPHEPRAIGQGGDARDMGSGAKLLIWGGIALGVAGMTAGAVLATRRVASLIAEEPPRRHPPYRYDGRNEKSVAPRFAELDEDEKEAIRRRVRAQARADERAAEHSRAEASRLRGSAPSSRPPRRKNIAHDLTRTATDLSASLESVAASVATAFESFRGVAAQASAIIDEFAGAADQVRSAIHGGQNTPPAAAQPPHSPTVRPAGVEPEMAPEEGPDDPRYHRL